MFYCIHKKAIFFGLILLVLLLTGTVLPLILPFLLGVAVAFAAEPAVAMLQNRLRIPRRIGTAAVVSALLLLGCALFVLLLALLGRQFRQLGAVLPQMEAAAGESIAALRTFLLQRSAMLPGSLADTAGSLVEAVFSDGPTLLGKAAQQLPQLAGKLLSGLSDGLLWLLTGIISAYMLSARLPQLKQAIIEKLPETWCSTGLPALHSLRRAVFGWILAECKLAGIAFLFLLPGFWLLRVDHAFVWATLITLVDAFPILGVGTVLLPWSMVCLLQGNRLRGVGLLGLYGAIWLTRSILEPRLIGKELGLDPLVTLMAIYIGFRLWGIGGMLLAPLAAMVAVQLQKHLGS